MAKGKVDAVKPSAPKRSAAKGKATSTRTRIVIALVSFVVLAIGVNLRRMYGVSQATQIAGLQQQREALISEQLKVQDAIRVASDRSHIIAIAQSRLNMKLAPPNQVIFVPRRPIGRDSLTP